MKLSFVFPKDTLPSPSEVAMYCLLHAADILGGEMGFYLDSLEMNISLIGVSLPYC